MLFHSRKSLDISQLINRDMVLNVSYLVLLMFVNVNNGLYNNQHRVYQFDNYTVGMDQIESEENHADMELYFEAIKETFDLYNRDEKYKNGKICKSPQVHRDIVHRSTSYANLKRNFDKNCSYVIGNLVIANINDEDISFLNSIEEISGYLFVFSNSAESISLNNLKVIRGENPWIRKGKKFSLVVGNNFSKYSMLRYLLLPSLQVILRYNILFYENPGLSYIYNKVNWDLLIGESQQMLILSKENYTVDEPKCHPSCKLYLGKTYCWNNGSFSCQKINNCIHRNCSDGAKCYINKNVNTEECCHDQCAGGCTGPSKRQCLACKNFNNNGVCIEYCPQKTIHDGIKHVENPHGKLAFNHMCVDKCPVKFFNEFGNCVSNCTSHNTYAVNQTCLTCPNNICPKICRSKDVMTNPNSPDLNRLMLDRLENCTTYDGNIKISTLSIEGDLFHEMPTEIYGIRESDLKKLSKLTEIYGYLSISVSNKAPWLKNLTYFKSLKIIRAETLGSPKSNGLVITKNEHLIFLGLQSLKEVRNGDIKIMFNPNLCLTETLNKKSIKHSRRMRIFKNGYKNLKSCENLKCSKECDSNIGCWDSTRHGCVKCENYQIISKNLCTSNCSNEPGYFYQESISKQQIKVCSECHSECNATLNTCRGLYENQCNFGCKNKMHNGNCVTHCPPRHYNNHLSGNKCYSCHETCTDGKWNSSRAICNGPDGLISRNGCFQCNHVVLDLNVTETVNHSLSKASYLLKCLKETEICPSGYFKFLVDFRSTESYSRRLTSMSNNSLIIEIFELWFHEATNHKLQIGSICLPCHPDCSECTDASNWHCNKCKYLRSDNKCVKSCSSDFYIEEYYKQESYKNENECLPCHEECDDGCYGPTEYNCKRCRHVKIYSNSSGEFFCNSTCGDLIQIYKGSEIVCVETLEFGKFTFTHFFGGSIIILIVLIGISLIIGCIISCVRRKKAFDMKIKYLNDFYATETDQTNSGIMPNMATLLLITESQLDRQDVIGSGAFGVVYKGIWRPNIDIIDKSSSFLKRNLSKFSQDNSIKLVVAVKSLTNVSDPANNRELLEEAKVMASVDHPCCLRILAVCLTAQPKLITQFMPLGSLLEFCQRHRSIINNASLLIWAQQIACGMEYLESKGIIHCDLAARNVLVQSPRQVKITDFGLAKILDHSQQQYQFKGGRMPIKWLAIECIRNRIFSSKSDVWSYGVTLWEMFTFGEKPFPEIKAFDILEHLEKGQRLCQPKICSIDAYTILIQCWLVDPDARPSFTDLRKTFEMMSKNPNRYLLIQGSEKVEPFYVDWEEDALKYDEFLQALVTVPHLNTEYESTTPNPVEKKNIKSIKNRYREMRTYKNCFMNNEIYTTNATTDKSNSANSEYTEILFEKKQNSNETGSMWSDYSDDKNNRMSSNTLMTSIHYNSTDLQKSQVLNPDLTDDGYLIPKSSINMDLLYDRPYLMSAEKKPETIIYSCENKAEKELLINHESSM